MGDPTRHAIYRWLAVAERPVSIAEVVAEFGLNHNTIRQHLAKLRAADLIAETKAAPEGPGRPRLMYALTAEAAADWNDEGPYQRLAMMLLEVAASGSDAETVGERVGRSFASSLAPGADPVDALVAAMASQGFSPRVERTADRVELVLDHCPFAAAAAVHPEVVCALHRGMARGTAESVGGVHTVGLTPKPPQDAGCRLEVSTARERVDE